MAFAGAFGIEHGAAFVECYGLAGDDSWARRGFQPLLTRYYRPLTEVAAQSVAVMQAPVAAPTPPKRKRGRPRKQVVNGVDAEVADAAR
jgi:hypothetical protein